MAEIAYPLFRSIKRGLAHRCPCCGKGGLFSRYLKVEPTCGSCGHSLTQYPADDGPAYVTILLTGHLIVAPMLLFPIVWEANPLYSVPLILTVLAVLMLLALPRVKGGWIGLMYALQVTDRNQRLHTADAAD
ncbi:DUF983 domain-containing protein [Phenylobacterium kunshanense]|uniref:DUF983 domain-containing protein n=1 Tax=Phenylobacterium kunshanense TaxID=1445034 RepID=A0A328BED6_9CAUL|nr:DUF983 domain-containing protein [Phenylobacterium kunshanense]RAK65025.1 hypothetical protein DJ019_12370 [Phenylobacterium kunshanense]